MGAPITPVATSVGGGRALVNLGCPTSDVPPERRQSLPYIGRNNRLGVLDFGRRREIRSNQSTPFREAFRSAKSEVVVNGVPLGDQQVAVRLFYRTVQLEPEVALGRG